MWEAPLSLSVQSNFPKWAWTSQILSLGGSSQYHTVLFFLGESKHIYIYHFLFSQSNIYFGFDIFIVIKLFRVCNLVFQRPAAVITIAARADQTAPTDTFQKAVLLPWLQYMLLPDCLKKLGDWHLCVCVCVARCSTGTQKREFDPRTVLQQGYFFKWNFLGA